jgi:hypothetical protein
VRLKNLNPRTSFMITTTLIHSSYPIELSPFALALYKIVSLCVCVCVCVIKLFIFKNMFVKFIYVVYLLLFMGLRKNFQPWTTPLELQHDFHLGHIKTIKKNDIIDIKINIKKCIKQLLSPKNCSYKYKQSMKKQLAQIQHTTNNYKRITVKIGKIFTKVYKTNPEFSHIFSKDNTHTSAWDNTMYNMHSLWFTRLIIKKHAQMQK